MGHLAFVANLGSQKRLRERGRGAIKPTSCKCNVGTHHETVSTSAFWAPNNDGILECVHGNLTFASFFTFHVLCSNLYYFGESTSKITMI